MPDNGVYGWNIVADSNDATADSTAGMPEGIAAALVNNRYRGALARLRAWAQTLGGAATNGGTGNAYTLTSPSGHALTAYVDGMLVGVTLNATNTGAATLNVDGLGALAIQTPAGTAMASGDLVSGGTYLLRLKTGSPNVWHVISGLATMARTNQANTWTAIQGFSTTAQMTLGSEFRIFESTNNNHHGVRNNANTLAFRYNGGSDYLTVANTGVATFASRPVFGANTPYDSGNLPGTAITWAAAQTFGVAPVFTDAAGSRTALGLGTSNSPQFASIELGAASDTTLSRLSAGVLGVEGATVYTSGNLPGTAITWTAAQTFGATLDISAGQILRFLNGANNRVYIDINATTLNVSRQTSGGVYLDSPINFAVGTGALNLSVTPTVAGNAVYHAGNLPGTSISWTAQQFFTASSNNGPRFANPYWAWLNAGGTRNGFIQFQDAGVCIIQNEVTNQGFNIVPNGTGLLQRAGNTIFDGANLPGTALSWTAAQTFTAQARFTFDNATSFDRPSSALLVEWRTGGVTRGFIGADASNALICYDAGGTSRFTVTQAGVAQVGGNTVYHAGNLPGTALTWTAQQIFSTSTRIVFNRTDSAALMVEFQTAGTRRGSLGADATYSLRAYNASDTETFRITHSSGLSEFLFNVDVATSASLRARTRRLTTTTGTLVAADANCVGTLTGNITLPNSIFATDDMQAFNSGAASRTVTRGAGIAMHLFGTDVATATLPANTFGGVYWETASKAILTGGFV